MQTGRKDCGKGENVTVRKEECREAKEGGM